MYVCINVHTCMYACIYIHVCMYVHVCMCVCTVYIYICVTVYRKTGHNAACVNIEKRSIAFLKMYCFKPTEGNG